MKPAKEPPTSRPRDRALARRFGETPGAEAAALGALAGIWARRGCEFFSPDKRGPMGPALRLAESRGWMWGASAYGYRLTLAGIVALSRYTGRDLMAESCAEKEPTFSAHMEAAE